MSGLVSGLVSRLVPRLVARLVARLLSTLAAAAAVLVLGACSSDDSGPRSAASSNPSAGHSSDSMGSHTPTELKHPCDLIPGRVAGRELGAALTAKKIGSQLTARTLDCSYIPAKQDVDAPFLEIQSTPDPTPLDALVGLYLGVDRLQHHPADVKDADDTEVILQPGDAPSVTVLTKQGFVTHTIVLALPDIVRAERVALRLMTLLVAGNR